MSGQHSPECVAARAKWRGRLARLIDGISRGRRSGRGAAAQHRPEPTVGRATQAGHEPNPRTLGAIGFAM
jgi:hypothetical protein